MVPDAEIVLKKPKPNRGDGGGLAGSARSALFWGAGFTFVRDLVQFAAMLILVRLLSPQVYGQVALAQSVIGFLAIASLKTFAQYPLQARDPGEFDWDAHFTAGTVANIAAFVISVVSGLSLWLVGDAPVKAVGMLIAFMSPIFLFEIAGTYYGTWLSAHHLWGRQRLLLLTGSVVGACLSILLAWAGFGAFALASASLLFSVPLVVDFLLFAPCRPQLSLPKLREYESGFRFALGRVGSAGLTSGRAVSENAAMSGLFSFALLGSFSRAFGLAQMTSGRVGPLATQTLYAVLTRAEQSSERFRRFSTLLLQGVVWATLPAAAFVGLQAAPIVELLYGPKWESVARLLPLVSLILAIRGVSGVLNQVMLANLQARDCFKLDLFSALAALVAIPIAMPAGLNSYLGALIVVEMLAVLAAMRFAVRGLAIDMGALVRSLLSSSVATGLASVVLLGRSALWEVDQGSAFAQALFLLLDAGLFGGVYLLFLRLLAPNGVSSLLEILPMGSGARAALRRFSRL